MDQPQPTDDVQPSGLLIAVELLPAARDRDERGGAVTDNDGNDR
jgi:hypothetical protein